MTSAEPFALLLDEPDVVDADVVSGVQVRGEPLVTEVFGGPGVLGFGRQQHQYVHVSYKSFQGDKSDGFGTSLLLGGLCNSSSTDRM